jgi:thioesterase domain-containing protein
MKCASFLLDCRTGEVYHKERNTVKEIRGSTHTAPTRMKFGRILTCWERVKMYVAELQNKDSLDVLRYFGESFTRFSNCRRNRFGMDGIAMKRYEKKGRGKDVRSILLNNSKPEAYDGKVTLFAGADLPWYTRGNPLELWTDILRQVKTGTVPGNHMSMLKLPWVAELARLPRHQDA